MLSLRRVASCPNAGRQSTTGGVKAVPQMATRKTIKYSPVFQLFSLIRPNILSDKFSKSFNKVIVLVSISIANSELVPFLSNKSLSYLTSSNKNFKDSFKSENLTVLSLRTGVRILICSSEASGKNFLKYSANFSSVKLRI